MLPADDDLLETNIISPSTRQWGAASGSCPALSSYGIRSVGVAQVGLGYKIVRLRPTFGHINICLEGSGLHLVDRQWIELPTGAAILRPAFDTQGAWQRERKPWRMAWVIFDERTDPLASRQETVSRVVQTDPAAWDCALKGLRLELETFMDPQHLAAWAQTVFLLSRRVLSGEVDRLAPLWQHVESRLAHPWSVTELAAWAEMSEVHLRRLTRAAWHRSPMQHVSWLRIRRAEYLFSLPGQTVENVAAEVGYESPSSFTAAFKRWRGRSPRAAERSPGAPGDGPAERRP